MLEAGTGAGGGKCLNRIETIEGGGVLKASFGLEYLRDGQAYDMQEVGQHHNAQQV